MSKKNELTPFVRQCMALWLAENKSRDYFTVSEICSDLKLKHDVLDEIDLTKYVSNDLIRLEKVGILKSYKGVVSNGTGRPPKVYQRVYCQFSIDVMSGVA